MLAVILDFQIPVKSHIIAFNAVGLLDLENTGTAVEMALLFCLHTEMNLFPVSRPTSDIFDSQFYRTVFTLVALYYRTLKTYVPLQSSCYRVPKRKYMHFRFGGRQLGISRSCLVAQYCCSFYSIWYCRSKRVTI